MCDLGESPVPHCVYLSTCLFFYLCKHYRKVWAKKGQEMLTCEWDCEAFWAVPGIMSSFKSSENHPQQEQLSMTLESGLGQDFGAKLGMNGYSGPALAVDDQCLECSLTEQWVGVQGVKVITIILCRETVGEKSLQDAEFLSWRAGLPFAWIGTSVTSQGVNKFCSHYYLLPRLVMTGELSSCCDKREQTARIVHVAFNLCVCLRGLGKRGWQGAGWINFSGWNGYVLGVGLL